MSRFARENFLASHTHTLTHTHDGDITVRWESAPASCSRAVSTRYTSIHPRRPHVSGGCVSRVEAKNCSGCSGAGAVTITAPATPRCQRPWGGRSSDYWLMLICIHHKTYGSGNKNKKTRAHRIQKNRLKLHKYTIQPMLWWETKFTHCLS